MSTTDEKIAGALFDFLGYLTSRETEVTLSGHHDATPGLDALEKWAARRQFSLENADVEGWQA